MPRPLWRFRRALVAGRHQSPDRDRSSALPGRSPANRTPRPSYSAANAHEGYPAPAVGDLSARRCPTVGSREPPLEFGVKVLGFFQECRDRGGDLRRRFDIVSVACPSAHLPKAPPSRPGAPQQALSVSGADQIGKGQTINFVGRSRGFLEIPSQHLVAKLIGEFEALDQPVAKLLIRRLVLGPGETLAKAPHRIAERGDVELHRWASPKTGSRDASMLAFK